MIVVEEHAVDERIDELPSPLELLNVNLPVIAKRHPEFVLCKRGRFFLFRRDGLRKRRLLPFQLRQSCNERVRRRAPLNGIDDVPDLFLALLELLLEVRQNRAFLVLQLIEQPREPLDDFIRLQQLHRPLHDERLDLLLIHLLLVAEVPSRTIADVVAVRLSRLACARIGRHHRPAVTAEEPRREQIVVVLAVGGRRDGMLLHGALHFLKQFFGDERRHGVLEDDARVTVLAEIDAVGERVEHAVVGDGLAVGAAHLFRLEIIVDLFGGIAVRAHLEHFLDDGRGGFIDFEFMVYDLIPEGHRSAVPLALEGVLLEAALDVLREVGRIEFRHAFEEAFEDDALGAVRDVLFGGHDTHAVLAEGVAVEGGIVTIAGKAIELPDEDDVKQLLRAVLYHTLKVGTVVRLGRKCPVYVLPDDLQIVILGILRALPDLPLDAFLSLIVRAIPRVNNCLHSDIIEYDIYFCAIQMLVRCLQEHQLYAV